MTHQNGASFNNVGRNEAYKEIGSALYINPKLHSISDLIGGLTNNERYGDYYHPTVLTNVGLLLNSKIHCPFS